jgi:hypothetical protein
MNPPSLVVWLGWACYAGAGVAIVAYIVHFTRQRGWNRPWNAVGLFFSAIALTQTPAFFLGIYDPRTLIRAVVVTVCLLGTTGVQVFIALRPRRRDGEGPPDTPRGPAP